MHGDAEVLSAALRTCGVNGMNNSYSIMAGAVMSFLTLLATATHAEEEFAAGTLRGLHRVQVVIEGIAPDFERYGLSAAELRHRVEAQLTAAGIVVANESTAQSEADVGQVRVKLNTVEAVYSLYSYAVTVQVRRKLALGGDGHGYISQPVWTRGQNGVLNPSDLPQVYGFSEALIAMLVLAHGSDNGAAHATVN